MDRLKEKSVSIPSQSLLLYLGEMIVIQLLVLSEIHVSEGQHSQIAGNS